MNFGIVSTRTLQRTEQFANDLAGYEEGHISYSAQISYGACPGLEQRQVRACTSSTQGTICRHVRGHLHNYSGPTYQGASVLFVCAACVCLKLLHLHSQLPTWLGPPRNKYSFLPLAGQTQRPKQACSDDVCVNAYSQSRSNQACSEICWLCELIQCQQDSGHVVVLSQEEMQHVIFGRLVCTHCTRGQRRRSTHCLSVSDCVGVLLSISVCMCVNCGHPHVACLCSYQFRVRTSVNKVCS